MQYSTFLPKYKFNLLVKRAFFKSSLLIFWRIGPKWYLKCSLFYIFSMQNTYKPKHIHNKQHKIWNSLYQSQNLLTNLIPLTFIVNKTESNWKQLCRVHHQVSRLSWWWLSASGATADMPGLYFSVYTARMVAVYSEVQMFTDLAECVMLHTP